MTKPDRQRDWLLSDFDFALPEKLIAAKALEPRDSARLLHVQGATLSDNHVFDLPSLLRPGDVLVLNDTKVIPARLYGTRGDVKVEILLNKAESYTTDEKSSCSWSVLARPGKRLHVGEEIRFGPDFSAIIREKREGGVFQIEFALSRSALFAQLKRYGHVPLPPYIKRADTLEDRARYQTVYAEKEGAVAAPTAGLHLTPELFAKLDAKGIRRETVTLHVGAGTFLPVKTERVADHHMHAEWGEIAPGTAARLNEARAQGRRLVSVGTTPLRLLESAADEQGIIRPFCGETAIFITPGYRFRAVDALMTNFHLPKSTLFMLVCAFAGMNNMKAAYAHAIEEKYRFYSYGDSSLLEKTL